MPMPALAATPQTKVNAEVLVFFSLESMCIDFVSSNPAGASQTDPYDRCGSFCIPPNSPLAGTVTMSPNKSAVGPIPANSPMFTAAEDWWDVAAVAPGGALVGDVVYQFTFPDPAPADDNDDYTLICFDQGVVATPGVTYRAIPQKFMPVDHYVRQRPENTISLTDIFVSNWQGLQRIRGIPVTLMVQIRPYGGNGISEIQLYSDVVLNPQTMNSGAEGNDSVTISMEGNFGFCAIFSAL